MTSLRTISALVLATALTACGGQYDVEPSVYLATATRTAAGAAQHAGPTSATSALPAHDLASAALPVPDCAPEGCAGLRIIDGNAEAWRIDAARRAQRDAGQPLS